MKCVYCEKEMPENSKFCPECGKAICKADTCKKCGQALPAGAKFCNNCGENVSGTAIASDDTRKEMNIVIGRKKQMISNQPVDIYIDDEFLGTFRCGDFINYKLDASKASSEINVRIVLLYILNNSVSLFLTLKPNDTASKLITVVQDFNSSKPNAEITGFDVVSRTQSAFEKYRSPQK